ncbi:MAG: DUF924 family protein [Alphaproteobacteria bacterium]|jgi:uncharacterized protein (DUF924 family)|nr:DUF924 family protein [Alphaproteobacteria bacterium]MDP7223006.1 DUF924 family protein [Alphaproteobacteria bacterium]
MRDTRQDILNFWFVETPSPQWFQKSDVFDQQILERFKISYKLAREGACDGWQDSPDGTVALCLLLDQFPRRMFRGTEQAYHADKQALLVAKRAIARECDQALDLIKQRFIYMPFTQSENLADQQKSVQYFEKNKEGDPVAYMHAQKRCKVIEAFGRFPQRNAVLGRENTPEEEEYLADPRSVL